MKPTEEFYSSYLANCVLNAFFSYTAIMLNIVTIHAIRKTPSVSKPLKILLLNLAVSDLGVGSTAAPLYIAVLVMQVTQNTENNGIFSRTFTAFLITWNLFAAATLFLVTALIADRFLSIYAYLRYQHLVTRKSVVAVVVAIWTFSASLSALRMCISVSAIYMIAAIISFVFATTVMVLSCKTFLAARGQINQIHALELTGQQASQNGELVNVARLRKFATSAVFVSVAFLLCYLPNMFSLWALAITSKPLYSVVQNYTLTLVLVNSSLNPLIYCWKMRHIRQAVMNVLRSVWSRHH